MKTTLHAVLAGASCAFFPCFAQAGLTLLNHFGANQGSGASAGEIIAFDPGTDRLFVSSSSLTLSGSGGTTAIAGGVHQVNIFGIGADAQKTDLGVINFSDAFGGAANMRGLSSVAVDPLGRFGVATLIPTNNATTPGKLGFFNLSTGAVIGTVDVGYHPDSVTFSADGSRLVVVNEGEFNPNVSAGGLPYVGTNAGNVNAPGSISYLNVAGIGSGNLNDLPGLAVTTRDFSAGNLAAGVSIDTLRNANLPALGTSGTFINTVPVFNTAAPEAIEPEFASVVGDKVYVSLQDNNALAVFDFTADKWVEAKNLGTISQTIDATDQNASGATENVISISKTVAGLPMPDTVGTYTVAGKTYVVTANEGDARVDDRDISRFGDTGGNDSMNNLVDTNAPSNFPITGTGERALDQLGRLNVSRIDGDGDGDGKIDTPTMIGTRSFSIFEQTEAGLTRVYDSGSFLETHIAASGGWVDSRSDDKGPEPEGLTVAMIGGNVYLFIGMERTGHIMMFDVTDPTAVAFMSSVLVPGAARPEGFNFVSAANSPTGTNILIVGFEGDGTDSATERIAIFEVTPSVVPEPASFAAIAGLMALGGVAMRRRRRA
jgi:hypothetical protein